MLRDFVGDDLFIILVCFIRLLLCLILTPRIFLAPRNFYSCSYLWGTWTHNLLNILFWGTWTLCLHSFLTSALACDQQGLPGLTNCSFGGLEPLILFSFKGLKPCVFVHLIWRSCDVCPCLWSAGLTGLDNCSFGELEPIISTNFLSGDLNPWCIFFWGTWTLPLFTPRNFPCT